MSATPRSPLHNPQTEFHGEIQQFTGTSLPLDDPEVKARVRKGRPGESNAPTNYWVVGAMYGGSDDQYEAFIRRGYWDCWGPGDKTPPEVKSRFAQIEIGDRIAVKRLLGRGATEIEIRAIGIVIDVDRDDWCVYVKWVLTDLTRKVPLHGCAGSIHGPFRVDQDWTRQVFHL
jgi:hypothetical protein